MGGCNWGGFQKDCWIINYQQTYRESIKAAPSQFNVIHNLTSKHTGGNNDKRNPEDEGKNKKMYLAWTSLHLGWFG